MYTLPIPTNIPVSKESFPMPDAVWCSVNISVSPYQPLPSKEEKGREKVVLLL